MNYSLNSLDELEHDISFWCSRYWVPGYELEDLEQECRIAIWRAYNRFNPYRGAQLRTWANMVVKNRLRELLRNSHYDKRAIGHKLVHQVDACQSPEEDLDSILSILIENNMTLDDLQ